MLASVEVGGEAVTTEVLGEVETDGCPFRTGGDAEVQPNPKNARPRMINASPYFRTRGKKSVVIDLVVDYESCIARQARLPDEYSTQPRMAHAADWAAATRMLKSEGVDPIGIIGRFFVGLRMTLLI